METVEVPFTPGEAVTIRKGHNRKYADVFGQPLLPLTPSVTIRMGYVGIVDSVVVRVDYRGYQLWALVSWTNGIYHVGSCWHETDTLERV